MTKTKKHPFFLCIVFGLTFTAVVVMAGSASEIKINGILKI